MSENAVRDQEYYRRVAQGLNTEFWDFIITTLREKTVEKRAVGSRLRPYSEQDKVEREDHFVSANTLESLITEIPELIHNKLNPNEHS